MAYLILLSISFIIPLWVFYDSQKQGYTVWKGLLWAIGVFFAPILFIPLYLFYRYRRRKRAEALAVRQPPPPLTTCFYCGKGYEGSPPVCPYCGQSLKI